MDDPRRALSLKPVALAAAVIAIIVYGSLYPFSFGAGTTPQGAAAALLATWREPTSRGDIVSNILLYLPLGLFAARALTQRSWAVRVALAMAIGTGLSVAVELVQFYSPSRTTRMSDVYANAMGTLLGAALAGLLNRSIGLPSGRDIDWRTFPLLLLASWCGYRLFPYVPTIDLHKYWDALKPLVFAPRLAALDLYRHTVTWLVVAVLTEALFRVHPRLAFALLVAGILAMRILILDTVLSPAEVAGAALALTLWLALQSRLPWRTGAVALLLACLVIVQSLEPFSFIQEPRRFGWIPFLSFMQGSIETNIRSMFEKVFAYGSLLWLLSRAGLRLSTATALSALLVLALRYAQVYLPARSAEITDFVLVLVLALAMKLLADEPVPHEARPRPVGANRG